MVCSLIQTVSDKNLESTVNHVKALNYFSIIITRSHPQQLSITRRNVALRAKHFPGFVTVEVATGLNLSGVVSDEPEQPKVPLE